MGAKRESRELVTNGNMIPLARPVLGKEEMEALSRPLSSGWVTQGPEVAAFEAEFASAVRSPHAAAVCNCTAALHLALRAVGVTAGCEVITVSHSFIATANSIVFCGATPVFVDIEAGTYNISPRLIEQAISERTRAILCVHQMGMPCDLSSVLAIARRHGLAVVEDAACAIGSEALLDGTWQRIGRPHGDVACFSFHPRKVVTTGDGGMLTTSVDDWDARVRLWRQHGMSVPDHARHEADRIVIEEYLELGHNYRMTDLQAAVGRAQLSRLSELVHRRRELAGLYDGLLRDVPGLLLPEEPEWARSNWQSYCVRLPDRCDQRKVMEGMLNDGIATRRGIMCAHLEPAFVQGAIDWRQEGSLAESEAALGRSILLPLYPQMSEEDQERVCGALRKACAR